MTQQLGFGFEAMHEEAQAAHLPTEMEQAIPVYRQMLERHNAAMLAGDHHAAMAIRKEANRLAKKLNGGDVGILANDDSPANVLTRETTAPPGTLPMWGQQGEFTITVGETPIRIEVDGMFGVCASLSVAPGFSAHAVDRQQPFISETGYRSFLGNPDVPAGMTVDQFCKEVIDAHLKGECKGKMRDIKPEYRSR